MAFVTVLALKRARAPGDANEGRAEKLHKLLQVLSCSAPHPAPLCLGCTAGDSATAAGTDVARAELCLGWVAGKGQEQG